jgi:hypothetical protein
MLTGLVNVGKPAQVPVVVPRKYPAAVFAVAVKVVVDPELTVCGVLGEILQPAPALGVTTNCCGCAKILVPQLAVVPPFAPTQDQGAQLPALLSTGGFGDAVPDVQ